MPNSMYNRATMGTINDNRIFKYRYRIILTIIIIKVGTTNANNLPMITIMLQSKQIVQTNIPHPLNTSHQ